MSKEEIRHELQQLMVELEQMLNKEIDNANIKDDFRDTSYSQMRYLKKIAEMGNPTLSELAASLNYSKPSVTVAVAKLEKQGFIERIHSVEDKRSFNVRLSEKGENWYEASDKLRSRMIDNISGALEEKEIRTLMGLYRKLVQHSLTVRN